MLSSAKCLPPATDRFKERDSKPGMLRLHSWNEPSNTVHRYKPYDPKPPNTYSASSARFLFCFLSATDAAAVSGGAIKASSLWAFFFSLFSVCLSSRFRLSMASFSLGLRKYSPDASC